MRKRIEEAVFGKRCAGSHVLEHAVLEVVGRTLELTFVQKHVHQGQGQLSERRTGGAVVLRGAYALQQ